MRAFPPFSALFRRWQVTAIQHPVLDGFDFLMNGHKGKAWAGSPIRAECDEVIVFHAASVAGDVGQKLSKVLIIPNGSGKTGTAAVPS